MKVKDLIQQLSTLNPEREIVIQLDSDGNGYSPCSDIWVGLYQPITKQYGEASLEELTAEDREFGYMEEDILSEGTKAVFLCPLV